MRRWLSVISYPRDYAIFLPASRHGLRASEIGLISVDAIGLNQQRIRLQRLQGSLPSTQPMKPDEIKAIKRALKARSIRARARKISIAVGTKAPSDRGHDARYRATCGRRGAPSSCAPLPILYGRSGLIPCAQAFTICSSSRSSSPATSGPRSKRGSSAVFLLQKKL